MSEKIKLPVNAEENACDYDLLWNIPQDVLDEWSKLSLAESQSLSCAIDALLDEIAHTLATVTINTKLLPVATAELTKRLKDFRLSLKEMPFPQNSGNKKLH